MHRTRKTSLPLSRQANCQPPCRCRFKRGKSRTVRSGAMLVLILLLLVGFMVTVAFSIDIAQMNLAKTQLRTATDAAAKAAAQTLSTTQDIDQAIASGQAFAETNTVVGTPLLINAADFSFGRSQLSNNGRFVFSPSSTQINSVRVLGRRSNGSPSGPVPLFFGNFLGVDFFEPENVSAATFIERDVVLVVDRSGSMAGGKFRSLVTAISIFVETLKTTPVDEHVGLASYSSNSSVDVLLTPDLDSIPIATSRLPVAGLTSISAGMQAGQAVFRSGRPRAFVERTMIVMTDGQHNTGPEPITVVPGLVADGVQIHTITFGRGADVARMRQIAEAGSGQHFSATSGAQLAAIYREIALTLSTVITE